jgi:UDP-N-acetylglucosamine 2-epimerase (hydrolysing)
MKKKIFFVTSTRADYGKLKSIIQSLQSKNTFKTKVIVTGMHLVKEFGSTFKEMQKDNIKNLVYLKNYNLGQEPQQTLLNTIDVFTKFFERNIPDLIVIHGDRVEPLAISIICLLKNFKVAHIEGGEVSGTQDEMFRHAITKLSTIHFTTNQKAKKRILQMGENPKSVYVIGSPDMDLILSKNLPSIDVVKKKYQIDYKNYSIAILHSVTTESASFKKKSKIFFRSLVESKQNFIVLHPNNDAGREYIILELKKLSNYKKIKIFPSMRFEYFLTLLKNAKIIIGNSSAAIMEAPCYGIPSINVGTRQNNRYNTESIINIKFSKKSICKAIKKYTKITYKKKNNFGTGKSARKFENIIKSKKFWNIKIQKSFIDSAM